MFHFTAAAAKAILSLLPPHELNLRKKKSAKGKNNSVKLIK